MFASSGEITAPCGVPASTFVIRPSSNTPAFSHLAIRRSMRRPAHALLGESDRERIQRIMLATPRSEPVREPEELFLIDRVQDFHHRLLDYLIFQRGDAERTHFPVGLRYVPSPRRARPVCSPMHPLMEILQVGLQILSVGAPGDTVRSRSRFTPQRGVRGLQEVNCHMVEERRELLFRPLARGLPYAVQRR